MYLGGLYPSRSVIIIMINMRYHFVAGRFEVPPPADEPHDMQET